MPEVITLRVIQDLERRLARHLAALPSDDETNILIDTNQHAFESLACIKAFRDALEQSGIAERGSRVAFVTPAKYRAPEIVSEREAYFSDVATARAWVAAGQPLKHGSGSLRVRRGPRNARRAFVGRTGSGRPIRGQGWPALRFLTARVRRVDGPGIGGLFVCARTGAVPTGAASRRHDIFTAVPFLIEEGDEIHLKRIHLNFTVALRPDTQAILPWLQLDAELGVLPGRNADWPL